MKIFGHTTRPQSKRIPPHQQTFLPQLILSFSSAPPLPILVPSATSRSPPSVLSPPLHPPHGSISRAFMARPCFPNLSIEPQLAAVRVLFIRSLPPPSLSSSPQSRSASSHPSEAGRQAGRQAGRRAKARSKAAKCSLEPRTGEQSTAR